jgi:RNA polymerase sigma factor (sigma-70 family)
MAEPPLTRVTLLARIRDGRDADAWREFVHLYGPVVYRFARNRGLQDADAADLMQDVLRSVARNAPRMEYDPKRGTFRGWLYTVTRNKIYNFLSAQRNRPRGTGDADAQERLDSTPARDEGGGPDAEWEKEYQRRISARAMEKVKDEFQAATWQAFWQTAVEGKAAAEVGVVLKMTAGAVYVAKSRVLARLRDEVQKMMEDEDETANARR